MTENDSTPERLDADGIAYTLTEAEAERRRERASSDLFPHLESVTAEDGDGPITVAGTEEAVEARTAFGRREHQCCSFARFDLTITPRDETNRLAVSGEGADAMFEQGMKPLLEEYDPELLA
jgi:hypothetical protein